MPDMIIPYNPDFTAIKESDRRDIQLSLYKQRRVALLTKLFQGVPSIIKTIRKQNYETLYKIVMRPEGATMREVEPGIFEAVYREKGKYIKNVNGGGKGQCFVKLKEIKPDKLKVSF